MLAHRLLHFTSWAALLLTASATRLQASGPAELKRAMEELRQDPSERNSLRFKELLDISSQADQVAFRDAHMIEFMVNALKDTEPMVRREAAWATSKILLGLETNAYDHSIFKTYMISVEPLAVQALVAALKDADAGVRYEAAWSLQIPWTADKFDTPQLRLIGVLRKSTILESLIATLNDPDLSVRIRAINALGGTGDVRAVEALQVAAKDVDWRIATAAVEAMGTTVALWPPFPPQLTAGLVVPLIGALEDGAPQVRAAAADSLWYIKDAHLKDLTRGGYRLDQETVNAAASAAAALRASLQKRDAAVIVGIYKQLVIEPGYEDILISVLDIPSAEYQKKYRELELGADAKEIATSFLRSGNPILSGAALKWANANGYRVVTLDGTRLIE